MKLEKNNMRSLLIALAILLCTLNPAQAQISVGISAPGISIGINVPVYPQLVQVPGYPVYYDPGANSNYFFYDGLYWVYSDDNWYQSGWYNGPWQSVGPEYVPLFVLRVPVRYYRQPPPYFRGWRADASPRWGEHWGRDWEQRHSNWERWDRRSAPAAAPLPVYQRQYSGDRYPRAVEQQHSIRSDNYRYRPQEAATLRHFEPQDNDGNQRQEPQRPQRQEQERQPQRQSQQQQREQQQEQRQQEQSQRRQEQSERQRPGNQQQQQRPQQNQQVQPQQAEQAPPQGRSPRNDAQDGGRGNSNAAQDRGRKGQRQDGEGQDEERGKDRR
jgi:hypothetical protein